MCGDVSCVMSMTVAVFSLSRICVSIRERFLLRTMTDAPYLGFKDHEKGDWNDWKTFHKTEEVTEGTYWSGTWGSSWKNVGIPMPDCETASHWKAASSTNSNPSGSRNYDNSTTTPAPTSRPVSLKPNGGSSDCRSRTYKKTSTTTTSRSHSRGRQSQGQQGGQRGTPRSRSGARDNGRPRREERLSSWVAKALRASFNWWDLLQPNPKYCTMPHDHRGYRFVTRYGNPLLDHTLDDFCPVPLLGSYGSRWKNPWARGSRSVTCKYQGYDRDCRKGDLCSHARSREQPGEPFHMNEAGDYVGGDWRARHGTSLKEEDMFQHELDQRSAF